MTLIRADSFDYYAALSDMWPLLAGTVPTLSTTQARSGTQALRITGNNSYAGISLGSDEHATIFVGFGYYPGDAAAKTDLRFYGDNGNTIHTVLRIVSGQVQVLRGSTRIDAYAGTPIVAATWNYIECKIKLGDSPNGIAVVWVNGVEVINLATTDTKNAGTKTVIDGLEFCHTTANGASTNYIDDVYVLSGDSTAPNDRLGVVSIATLLVNGAGAVTEWTPSTGSNYQNVDDTAIGGDFANYNSAAAGSSGLVDTYTMEDLPVGTVTVHGVGVIVQARKSNSGPRGVAPLVYAGGTEYDQAAKTQPGTFLSETSQYVAAYLGLNPATGVAWTPTSVNNAEFGMVSKE